jgi:metal-sulfur cluster biosynthetic enzyme
VRRVDVRPGRSGAIVEVVLGLTEPTCLMGFPFMRSARERLSALPGVEQVEVSLDPAFEWSPSEMRPEYADLLERRRARLRSLAASSTGPAAR